MQVRYQTRWVSKQRREALKKSGRLNGALLLDSLNGFLVVEPVGSNLGDGTILTPEEAAFQLQDVWCLDPKTKVQEARKRLGLETAAAGQVVGAS
jgi:hypothetical protein